MKEYSSKQYINYFLPLEMYHYEKVKSVFLRLPLGFKWLTGILPQHLLTETGQLHKVPVAGVIYAAVTHNMTVK